MPETTIEQIRRAMERIRPHVHRTPLLTSATLNRELGLQAFFKAEHLQKVGAFKVRGATNAVFSLNAADARRGVGAHSSGNHAAALAYASARRGIGCTVVMPETAPAIKVDAVRGYGADIVFCKQQERESTTLRLQEERGFNLIHPYEHPDVIAGQGTAALEMIEEQPGLDAIIAPVGGGGLMAGTTIASLALRPTMTRYGAEPEMVDDAFHSMQSGERQPQILNPKTWCDGLLTALGEPNFKILSTGGVEILRVAESEILQAAYFLMQRMKQIVEPSAATVLAALVRNRDRFREKRVGLILSGGNTDLGWLPEASDLPPLLNRRI